MNSMPHTFTDISFSQIVHLNHPVNWIFCCGNSRTWLYQFSSCLMEFLNVSMLADCWFVKILKFQFLPPFYSIWCCYLSINKPVPLISVFGIFSPNMCDHAHGWKAQIKDLPQLHFDKFNSIVLRVYLLSVENIDCQADKCLRAICLVYISQERLCGVSGIWASNVNKL